MSATAEEKPNNRILCVDDEKDIVQAYCDILAPAPVSTPKKSSRGAVAAPATVDAGDFEMLRAESGEQALALVKAELAAGRRIAGGFFDVKMDGGMDGIQTLFEIWKLDPELNATIVTAYQDRSVQDINQIFGAHFKDQWDYMNKPFSHGEIIQKARQMTASWNRRKSLEDTLKQLKAAQAQLIQAERMAAIGQVARGVGHEFGNVLQRIVGKADLALGENDISKVRADLQVILQASERASVIVRNLQAFSRGSSTKTDVELHKIIVDTLTLVNHEFAKYSVKCESKAAQVGAVAGNSVELSQVIMNLVINAIHAMPKGGALEIGCGESGPFVTAWVQDTGSGIPADVLPRIFEYAFTTKGDRGSGLGLSISKQIIEAHGGTNSVESELNKGTKFTIQLPKKK